MAVFISYISSWMSSFIWAWVVHIVWASLIQFWIKLCIWIEVCKAMPATVAVVQFSSVQFSCSVVSDSLRPHESQHARPPCPSPTPRLYPNPCPLSQWCHPATSSFAVPFTSCPQSLPASGSFPVSQLFTWGSQSIGISASTKVLPMNTQDWSLGWTGWIFLQFKGLSSLLQFHSSKASVPRRPTLTSIHDHWKNHSLDQTDLCWQSNVSAC